MSTRTFLSLDLDDAAIERLAKIQQRLAATGAKVRWTAPENQHVTMKFLGDVTDADLPRVCETAAEIAAGVESFEFAVERIVSVPPAGHMRMVWADIGDPTGRMAELADLLNDAYAAMGYKAENRRFKGHLTLGRVKRGANVGALRDQIDRVGDVGIEPQYADELVVYASELTSEGPIYTALSRAPLGEE